MEQQRTEFVHEIVDPTRIIGLLQRLMKEQVPLTVHPSEGYEEWYGTISELSFQSEEMLITGLNNIGKIQPPLAVGHYKISGKLSGATLNIDCDIIDSEQVENVAICRAAFPKTIVYRQRRSAERVGIWVDQKIPVVLDLNNDIQIKGHVRDISTNGVSACFYHIVAIDPDTASPTCCIEFPNGDKLCSKFEIRGVKVDDNIGQLHIRGRFIDLEDESHEYLEQFVNRLEQSISD